MEKRIIKHKVQEIDRHGNPTEVSLDKVRHTITLNNMESYTFDTELAPTIEDWFWAMRVLRNKCERGVAKE